MAELWIKVRKKLPRDGRVLRMARELGESPTTVLGALVILWTLADDYAEHTGLLDGYRAEDVDREVGIDGFAQALPSEWGRLEENGDVYLPEYTTHNGTTARKNAQNAKRQAKFRERNAASNAESVTRQDKTETRQDNRKEQAADAVGSDSSGSSLRVVWAEVCERWNKLANAHDLPELKKKPRDQVVKQYRSIISEYPEFWDELERVLRNRAAWYREKRQPNFSQATRRAYFDDKILGGEMVDKTVPASEPEVKSWMESAGITEQRAAAF